MELVHKKMVAAPSLLIFSCRVRCASTRVSHPSGVQNSPESPFPADIPCPQLVLLGHRQARASFATATATLAATAAAIAAAAAAVATASVAAASDTTAVLAAATLPIAAILVT